ncbi:hypothetical protein [uncultured Novosphingobium sp.]|nr:hypothetical protein [uncultured Novosphingobium sp.]
MINVLLAAAILTDAAGRDQRGKEARDAPAVMRTHIAPRTQLS